MSDPETPPTPHAAAGPTAGATSLSPALEKDRGSSSGHFPDPDGHPWEIAYHPTTGSTLASGSSSEAEIGAGGGILLQ